MSFLKWSLFTGHIDFRGQGGVYFTNPQKNPSDYFPFGGQRKPILHVFLLLVSGGMKWVYWLPAFGRWHSGTVAVCPPYPGDFRVPMFQLPYSTHRIHGTKGIFTYILGDFYGKLVGTSFQWMFFHAPKVFHQLNSKVPRSGGAASTTPATQKIRVVSRQAVQCSRLRGKKKRWKNAQKKHMRFVVVVWYPPWN